VSYKVNPRDVTSVKKYISKTWDVLTRTLADVIHSAEDPKTHSGGYAQPTIYIPKTDDFDKAYNNIKDQVPAKDFKRLKIEPLCDTHHDEDPDAMLYLPYPYVVPGGRFNEMYGWDSFFIIIGLIKDDRLEMAKNMARNILYEIHHYGRMLNANRAYYLTRSQPPIISESILAIYYYEQDKAWLKESLPDLIKFYDYWTTGDRLIEGLGLSRYYADSDKPLPDAEIGYHERVMRFYERYKVTCYDANRFYDYKKKKLKPAFFRADRSVRESGFDLSNKFGPFGADINNFAPVSLNSLLARMEQNLSSIYKILGNKSEEEKWDARYKKRSDLINEHLFEPDLGYYFDYNFVDKRNRLYIYATTFYPLVADIPHVNQAEAVIRNLPSLESNGGLMSSCYVTGMQWDAIFGWAPHQLFACKALSEYNAVADSRRLATKWISMINEDFRRTGKIYEKYDVVRRSSDVVNDIKYGYKVNVEGFGWTNAVYLHLLDYL
jgi:alpha,alpha-trehalase